MTVTKEIIQDFETLTADASKHMSDTHIAFEEYQVLHRLIKGQA